MKRLLFAEASEHNPDFLKQFFFCQRFGAFVFGRGSVAYHAAFDVMSQQFQSQSVQSGARGGNLVEDFDAITLVVHHFPDAGDLSRNAVDTRLDFLVLLFVHSFSYLVSVSASFRGSTNEARRGATLQQNTILARQKCRFHLRESVQMLQGLKAAVFANRSHIEYSM